MNAPWLEQLTPRRLLLVSVAVALLTMGLKVLAWWLTDSVGLLSDAMESLVNLAGASFGLWMVTIASRPADEDHPYGHHKAEYFSAGFEGVLIVAAALGIIAAALDRFLTPRPMAELNLGLAISVLASALNGGLAWVMKAAAKVHRSVALQADAQHLMSDVWTSGGVVLGLALAAWSGWGWLDPLVAVLVALNILKEGFHLVWRASQGLMDEALGPEEQQRIRDVLAQFVQADPDLVFDHLVTRRAAQRSYLDVHMHMPGARTLGQAEGLRVRVVHALMAEVQGLQVSIQMLPEEATEFSNWPRAAEANKP